MTTFTENSSPPKLTSHVAWGAVFAGTLSAFAMFLLMGSLAPLLDILAGNHSLLVISSWASLTAVISMFVAGVVTSKISQGEDLQDASFHGVLVWSSTAILTLYFAINGFGMLGSEMLIGEPVIENFYKLPIAAAFGFIAVLFSLLACIMGARSSAPKCMKDMSSINRLHWWRSRKQLNNF
jgi:hypothetical protein